ncbi:MAG: lipoate--protein ligase, partial [Desulfovibrio sp.]|nr:lipoate--protein ligase [Desulfovibrio sp.]
MRVILNSGMDPFFNLAAEEWLLTHSHDDIFMLWRNQKAVIVGRNQNTLAEINVDYVRKHGIPVVRRISGGGAVFHDPGNLNFTCIGRRTGAKLDFLQHVSPVLTALQNMGIPCAFSGRNDIMVGDKKISGNAQHISGDRVLHHGTLLFASSLGDMADALAPRAIKFVGKSVSSVRARVGRITDFLPCRMSMAEFTLTLLRYVTPLPPEDGFLPEETRAIENLATERYRTWEWNYGHSPRYQMRRSSRTAGGVIDAHLNV